MLHLKDLAHCISLPSPPVFIATLTDRRRRDRQVVPKPVISGGLSPDDTIVPRGRTATNLTCAGLRVDVELVWTDRKVRQAAMLPSADANVA